MAYEMTPSPYGNTAVPDDAGETPALDLLLGEGWVEQITTDGDGTPFQCTWCPFSSKSIEPYEQISNDVSEAHYACSLLEKVVWGEEAPCKPEDWQRRARAERAATR